MSYSSNIKEKFENQKNKSICCMNAYDKGGSCDIPELICERDLSAYLRGAFIACGSLTDPSKEYYLSWSPAAHKIENLKIILETAGLNPKLGNRKNKQYLYIKNSSLIEDFLTITGEHKAALDFMSTKLINELRGSLNRTTNAEWANQDRASTAAATQIFHIKKILKSKKFKQIPPQLAETAKLRLKYPELDLNSLAKKHKNPVSKSGLNHRFQRIASLAAEIENE